MLGTLVEIRVAGPGQQAPPHAAIDAAFVAVERVHRLMSFHEAGSDVSVLNREASHWVTRIDAQTWTVLAAAQRLS
ncbi:MAG: FAD:protein FMN transferase, partial [Nevskiales bacterium]